MWVAIAFCAGVCLGMMAGRIWAKDVRDSARALPEVEREMEAEQVGRETEEAAGLLAQINADVVALAKIMDEKIQFRK